MKLQDKVALVTGAGRGIGRAIALAFAREGADLVLASRTFSQVAQTGALAQALGCRTLPLSVDVSQPPEVETMVKAALEAFGRIDILVNNAGIWGPLGPLVDNDIAKWIEAIHINLIGVFLCCRAVLPVMISRRRGKIINLAGGGAAYARPYFSAYGTAKAAVVRLTESLAQEVAEFNIQVNAIAPGGVNTKLLEEVLEAGERVGRKEAAAAQKQQQTGGTPPEKAAALALFLASPEADGLSGRLLSAVWDDWSGMAKRVKEIMASDLYTLRRVVAPEEPGVKRAPIG